MASVPTHSFDAAAARQSIGTWLEMLRVMYPPVGIVHVGAGADSDLETYASWGVGNVIAIEAEPSRAKRLIDAVKGRDGWSVHQVLIDQIDGECEFFITSNVRESGLLPAQSLRPVWRNLQARSVRSMQAMQLDTLLASDSASAKPNWLVVDCLPAARILLGATHLLSLCDLLIVRVAFEDDHVQGLGLSLAEVDVILSLHSFVRLAVLEERVPMVGRALFVRNYRASLFNHIQKTQSESAAHHLDREAWKKQDSAQASAITTLTSEASELASGIQRARDAEQESRQQLEMLTASLETVQHALRASEASRLAAEQRDDARVPGLSVDVEKLRNVCALLTDQRKALQSHEMSIAGSSAHAERSGHGDGVSTETSIYAKPERGITSYAQNFEDVMLWRALGHVHQGFYIDIGAQDPIIDSVSRAFYENGWRGIHVEPTPYYAELLTRDRPDEIVVRAAIASSMGHIEFYEIPETGISTGDKCIAESHEQRGFELNPISVATLSMSELLSMADGRQVHWLKIDVEGMEAEVLSGWSTDDPLPWIVVIESTVPLTQNESYQSWEPMLLKKGYHFVYFDGLNRFYLCSTQLHLAPAFNSPPNVFDDFILSGKSTSPFVSRS